MNESRVGCWHERETFAPEPTETDALEAWAAGRDRFLVFALDVTHQRIHDAVADVRAALDAHDCTTVAPPEYYHVTLKQVGCLRDLPERDSDVTSATVAAIRDQARDIFTDIDPFTVRLPRVNLFPRVVFCEVRDAAPLVRAHQALCAIPEMPSWEYEGEAFVPHMTLGHFRETKGVDSLLADLEAVREVDARLRVDAVELLETPPNELYPSFRTVERYDL